MTATTRTTWTETKKTRKKSVVKQREVSYEHDYNESSMCIKQVVFPEIEHLKLLYIDICTEDVNPERPIQNQKKIQRPTHGVDDFEVGTVSPSFVTSPEPSSPPKHSTRKNILLHSSMRSHLVQAKPSINQLNATLELFHVFAKSTQKCTTTFPRCRESRTPQSLTSNRRLHRQEPFSSLSRTTRTPIT